MLGLALYCISAALTVVYCSPIALKLQCSIQKKKENTILFRKELTDKLTYLQLIQQTQQTWFVTTHRQAHTVCEDQLAR